MAGEWREHAMLKGRFRSDCPDDLQVIVHDGSPQISRIEPEIVWVTVTGVDGEVFRGRLRNEPHALKTMRQGGEIKFVMPAGNAPAALLAMAAAHLGLPQPPLAGWLAPILVTEKCLRERAAWVIHPCRKCGLSELFDAPSDLIAALFPNSPLDAEEGFTAPCPNCGGEQRVTPRRATVAGSVGSAIAGNNLGSTYLETAKLWAESMTAIGTLLASITDHASTDAALRELDTAIVRHNDLSAKLESYKMSEEAHMRLYQEQNAEYMTTQSDMTVSAATAQANAAYAQSQSPRRANDIEAAMKKIGLH